MAFDPIGPGTPAWRAFDKACEAWYTFQLANQKTRFNDKKMNPLYRRYLNFRQRMIVFVKKYKPEDVDYWCAFLDKEKRNYVPD